MGIMQMHTMWFFGKVIGNRLLVGQIRQYEGAMEEKKRF
jgi:hypothetical protein